MLPDNCAIIQVPLHGVLALQDRPLIVMVRDLSYRRESTFIVIISFN